MSELNDDLPFVVPIDALATQKPAPVKFLIDQLVPVDTVTLLAAHGGTGKTRLSLVAAICVAMGISFLDKSTIRSKVVFYSAEDDADQLQRIIHEVCVKLGVDFKALSENLLVVDASAADHVLYTEHYENGVRKGRGTAAFELLMATVRKFGAKLLIIDNVSDVFGADEVNRQLVTSFNREIARFARSIHGAAILLSHVDKMGARIKTGEAYSGSTAWHNAARSRLALTSERGNLALEHQKSNRGRLASPMFLCWDGGVPIPLSESSLSTITLPSHDPAYLDAVLKLIDEFYQRGEYVSTSTTSHTNAFKLLSPEPRFPKAIRKANELWPMLREAERAGRLAKEMYRSKERKPLERWRVVQPAPSAPSASSHDEIAQPYVGAEGASSAPSCVGGMGESAAHA